jgi:hypothetical protein
MNEAAMKQAVKARCILIILHSSVGLTIKANHCCPLCLLKIHHLSETSVHFYNVQSARESPHRRTKYFDEGANAGSYVPILDPHTGTTRAAQIVIVPIVIRAGRVSESFEFSRRGRENLESSGPKSRK